MRVTGGFSADDPDRVAAVGLAEIAHGPVFVMPGIRPCLDSLPSLPRAQIVEIMSGAPNRSRTCDLALRREKPR